MEIDMSKPYETEVHLIGAEKPLILANCEGPVAVGDGFVSFPYQGAHLDGPKVAVFNEDRIAYYVVRFYE